MALLVHFGTLIPIKKCVFNEEEEMYLYFQ